MDMETIDQEFEKLKTEFHDVAMTVTSLAEKMQVAETAGDTNATEWLSDLKRIAKDIDDEQLQAHTLLHTIHRFITNAAQAETPTQPPEKPPLFAPGQEPDPDDQQAQAPQRHGLFGGMGGGGMGGGMMGGGMMGGGMMGGGMMGGYGGSGFGRAMEMGMGMSLGANLMRGIFR
jgi:hypothetical protein